MPNELDDIKKSKSYCGYADIVDEADRRHVLWREQRDSRGFDDTELWNLDLTIFRFVYPRLKTFYENHIKDGLSFSEEQKIDTENLLVFMQEVIDTDGFSPEHTDEVVNNHMLIFAKLIPALWD